MPGTALTYTIVVTNSGPIGRDQRAGAGRAAVCVRRLRLDLLGEWGRRPAGRLGMGNVNAMVTLAGGHPGRVHTERDGAGGDYRDANEQGEGDAAGRGHRSGAGQQHRYRHQPGGPQADLAVTKSERRAVCAGGSADLHGGGQQRRTIEVTNARVQDALPAPWPALTGPDGQRCRRQCGTRDGTEYRCAGDLPAGSHVHLHGHGRCRPATTGTLINTATVAPPLGTTDPVPGNNTATDTNGGTAGGSVDHQAEQPGPTCRAHRSYTMVVSNAGPSNVTARVQDVLLTPLVGLTGPAGELCCGMRDRAGIGQYRCAGDAAGGHCATFT